MLADSAPSKVRYPSFQDLGGGTVCKLLYLLEPLPAVIHEILEEVQEWPLA